MPPAKPKRPKDICVVCGGHVSKYRAITLNTYVICPVCHEQLFQGGELRSEHSYIFGAPKPTQKEE